MVCVVCEIFDTGFAVVDGLNQYKLGRLAMGLLQAIPDVIGASSS